MDKKMMKYMGVLVGLVLITVIFLLIQNSLTGGVKYTYPEIEEKLVSAAKKYVKKKSDGGIDILPELFGEYYEITSQELIDDGYIDELSDYTKDNVKCYGSVYVYNAGDDNYDYTPELNCGDGLYETRRLSDEILETVDFVVQGSGLYQRVNGEFVTDEHYFSSSGSDDIEYVYRGENVNNYIKIDNNIWRIVSIDNDGNLLLIFNSMAKNTIPWDNNYNEDFGKNQGVNTYENNGLLSNAYISVQKFYNGELTLSNKEVLSDKMKNYIYPMDLCVGKRSLSDSDISGAIECQEVLSDQLIGMLPAYYFMSASIDPNCTETGSRSCGNHNYLASFSGGWWLLTTNSEKSNLAYYVSNNKITSVYCSTKGYLRPTIKIGARVVYSEGDGTKDNPYQIKYFND